MPRDRVSWRAAVELRRNKNAGDARVETDHVCAAIRRRRKSRGRSVRLSKSSPSFAPGALGHERTELFERKRERAKAGNDPGAEEVGLVFQGGANEHLLSLRDLREPFLSVADTLEANDTIADPHTLLEQVGALTIFVGLGKCSDLVGT